jgi:Tfp pilus assembly protein FimT
MHRPTSGFTLIEVFMVIALLGALGALMIINSDRLFSPSDSRPAAEVPALAVRAAHNEARSRSIPVYLFWDRTTKAFTLADARGQRLQHFPMPGDPETSRWEVVLHRLLPVDGNQTEDQAEPETWPTEQLVFHPAGAATVYQITVREGFHETIYRFDPFSAAPLSAVRQDS